MAKWAAFGVDPSGVSGVLETWLADTQHDAQQCQQLIEASWGGDVNIYVERTDSERVVRYFGAAEARRMQDEML